MLENAKRIIDLLIWIVLIVSLFVLVIQAFDALF